MEKTKLVRTLLAALSLGVFTVAFVAPLTLDLGNGPISVKSAFAKNGADDGPDGPDDNGGHGGHGGDDGPDGPDDNGGHGGDDGPGHK